MLTHDWIFWGSGSLSAAAVVKTETHSKSGAKHRRQHTCRFILITSSSSIIVVQSLLLTCTPLYTGCVVTTLTKPTEKYLSHTSATCAHSPPKNPIFLIQSSRRLLSFAQTIVLQMIQSSILSTKLPHGFTVYSPARVQT